MTAVTDLTAETAAMKTDVEALVVAVKEMAGNVIQPALSGAAANSLFCTLPPNAFVLWATIRETAGQPVKIGIGSMLGSTDVLAPVAIPANGGVMVPAIVFNAGWFSAGTPQPLFVTSTAWGGASVNVSLAYVVGP